MQRRFSNASVLPRDGWSSIPPHLSAVRGTRTAMNPRDAREAKQVEASFRANQDTPFGLPLVRYLMWGSQVYDDISAYYPIIGNNEKIA